MLLTVSGCDTSYHASKEENHFFFDEGESSYGQYLIGKFSYLKGAFDTSADYMKEAIEREPNNLHVAHAAMIPMLLAGDYKETEKLVEKLLGTKFEDEIVRIAHLTHLIAHKKFKEALSFIKEKPAQKEAFGLVTPLITLWLQLGLNEKINSNEVKDLITKSTTPEIYHYHLGNLYAYQNQNDKALEAYEFVKKVPENMSYRQIEVILHFLKNNGYEDKIDSFMESFKEGQADPYVYLYFVNHLKTMDKAATPITTILRGIGEIYIQFASTLIDTVALDLGIVFLRLTHHLEQDFELEKALYANALLKRGLYNDVLTTISDKPTQSPYLPFFILTEVDAELGLKQEDAALLSIETELPNHPNWAYLYTKKGSVEMGLKRLEAAEKSYTTAISLIAKLPDTLKKMRDAHLANYYFLRGSCYERLKNWASAEPDLERSLEINPFQPLVLNYLGYSWVDQGKKVEKGLALIQKALKMMPMESAFLDSLGWAFYKLKRYDEAVDLVSKALLITPDDPDLHHHLGDIYMAMGKKNEAHFEWRKALFFVEDDEVREEIEAKLKN